MNRPISFNDQADSIRQGDKQINSRLGMLFSQGCNEVVIAIFIHINLSFFLRWDENYFWFGGKGKVSDRKNFPVSFVNSLRTELEWGLLGENFTKKHGCWNAQIFIIQNIIFAPYILFVNDKPTRKYRTIIEQSKSWTI